MKKSIFNQRYQHHNVPNKIVAGLERISEAFRVLLWEHAKVIGLSPIQIQLIIFVAYHEEKLCNVSHLAKEFNMTKATISDAIRVLEKKELIEKITSSTDKRAFSISLSANGKNIVQETEHFADPIRKAVSKIEKEDQIQLFQSLSKIIYTLNRAGVLTVQRTCHACRYYEKKGDHHYCMLMKKDLFAKDIRLDCPEFEAS